MKGVIVLLFLTVSLVCIIPAQSFGAGDHPYVLEWGEFGITKDGQFLRPQHLAADDEENIYVADTGNAKIQKFSSDGKFLLSFGVRGAENGEFGSPVGIATHENNIYVVDSHLNSIKKFDSDGNFILKWGGEGSEDGKFSSPRGIEIDSEGVVYVVDTKNYRIQKFTTDGEFLSSFGSHGTTDERLRAPEDVTIYENNIYVSDPGNYKVIKFTSDGIFLKSFDYNMGGFPIRPYGLVSDLDGNVYFADTAKHRIVKIDSEGNSLTMWGQAGNAKGQFVEPIGIAFNNLGYLFVTDSSNNRIQKFQTPLAVEMQEALAAEQAEKLKELAYSEDTETEDTETEDNDQNVIPEKPLVRDLTKPVLVAPKDIAIEATGSLTPVDIGKAMAMDENGIQFLINNAPEMFSLGTSIIIWTAVDNSGNSSFATQEVNVVDTTPPIISSISDKIVEAVSPYQNIVKLEVPDADDILGVISVTSDAPEFFPLGETIVTWTSTDVAGNTASTEQRIILIDETSPVLQLPEDLVVEATSSDQNEVSLGDATATDNIDIASITNDAPDTFPLGETVVTWTATDSSGNSATATQTVSVVDTTAPSIIAPDGVELEATSSGSTVDIGNPVYDDLVDIASVTNDAPDTFPLGETVVTWTATDSSGNTATATQTVSIVDTTAPELIIPENIIVDSITIEKLVEIGEANAIDLVDTLPAVTNDAPEIFPLGDTIVTWSVADQFGNSASLQQIVSVQACGQSISYYNQILGTAEDDILMGTDASDLIFAFGGDDMIFGGEGNDCIIGGEGDDLIFGNAGNDHLVGGEGSDIIKGDSGDDKLTGGLGFDIIDGGDDSDVSYDSVSDIVIKCEEQL